MTNPSCPSALSGISLDRLDDDDDGNEIVEGSVTTGVGPSFNASNRLSLNLGINPGSTLAPPPHSTIELAMGTLRSMGSLERTDKMSWTIEGASDERRSSDEDVKRGGEEK